MHFQNKTKLFLPTYCWSILILLFCVYVFLRALFHSSAIMKLRIASCLQICIGSHLTSHIWSNSLDSFGSLPNYPQFSRSPESKEVLPNFWYFRMVFFLLRTRVCLIRFVYPALTFSDFVLSSYFSFISLPFCLASFS